MSFDLQLVGGSNDVSIGTLYYTLDGSDPRLPGGQPNPTAVAYDGSWLDIGESSRLMTRTLINDEWSALGFANLSSMEGLRGDVNADGVVDSADIDAITAAIRSFDDSLQYDLNSDEVVDSDDLDVLVEDILKTAPWRRKPRPPCRFR